VGSTPPRFEYEILNITSKFSDTCLSYWSDVVIGGSGLKLQDDVRESCVWRGRVTARSE